MSQPIQIPKKSKKQKHYNNMRFSDIVKHAEKNKQNEQRHIKSFNERQTYIKYLKTKEQKRDKQLYVFGSPKLYDDEDLLVSFNDITFGE